MNLITQNYIKHNSLYVAENENQVVLLGYELCLTKTEYKILKTLVQNTSAPLSAEQISSIANLELTKENVAFHVSSINKKAKCIYSRALIKNITKNGYFLN